MGRIELNAQSGKVIVNNIPFVGLIGICIPVAVIGAYLYVVPCVIHKGFEIIDSCGYVCVIGKSVNIITTGYIYGTTYLAAKVYK